MEYSGSRYLVSKTTVDDRALNKNVVEHLRAEIAATGRSVPRVLEIGAGLGTMVARLAEWRVLERAEYCLLDVDAPTLVDSKSWLAAWAERRGYTHERSSETLRIVGSGGIDLTIRTRQGEIGHVLEAGLAFPPADLLVANAFLDLVDVPSTLPRLLDLVVPGGVYWFSINYDGETIFEPEHGDDEAFMRVYNRSMDERVRYGRPAGDSKTGRRLFGHLASAGAPVLAAGASDWVVLPREGRYEADEAYFLHHIIFTIEEELKKHPEIDSGALAAWVALRHAQIEAGQVVYVAHQLDVIGRTAIRAVKS